MTKQVKMSDRDAELFVKFKKQQIKNHKPIIYGYARVSTSKQDYKTQIADLINAGVIKANIYYERYTGTTTKRPVFDQLKERLLPGDTVTVVKLDRLARNTREALNLMKWFRDHKIKLNVLNMGVIDDTPMGNLIFTVVLAFSQFERDLIVDRTEAGKQWSKNHKKDYRDGRPPKYSRQRLQLAYDLHYKKHKSMRQTVKMTGIPQSTLYDHFKIIRLEKEKEEDN